MVLEIVVGLDVPLLVEDVVLQREVFVVHPAVAAADRHDLLEEPGERPLATLGGLVEDPHADDVFQLRAVEPGIEVEEAMRYVEIETGVVQPKGFGRFNEILGTETRARFVLHLLPLDVQWTSSGSPVDAAPGEEYPQSQCDSQYPYEGNDSRKAGEDRYGGKYDG